MHMMKKLLLSAIIITSLTGCVTSDTTKSTDERPKLANIPHARWEGRNIYDFFYAIFEEGIPASSFTNEVFSTAPYKGVSWKIIQASRGMNVVGIDVPEPTHSIWDGSLIEFKSPFPIDEAQFVINRWSDVSYLKEQKFKQYVIFTGYEEGFVSYLGNTTNEVKKLCFLTADGWDDAVEFFQSSVQ